MPAQKKKPAKSKSAPSRKPSPAAASAPVRRGVGSLAAFLFAVFTFLILFGVSAVVLDFLKMLITALIGRGFYVLPFALLGVSAALMFHRGKPVRLRVFSILMLPVAAGALLQIPGNPEIPSGWAFFGAMLQSGRALSGGGLIGGTAGFLLEEGLHAVGAVILLLVVIAALLMVSFQTSPAILCDKLRAAWKNRPAYEPEDSPVLFDKPGRKAKSAKPEDPVPARRHKPKKSEIDIPLFLTDEQLQDMPPPAAGEINGKPPQVKTPAEALLETPPPVPVPQVFAFDTEVFIDPSTGEVRDAPPEPVPDAKPFPPDMPKDEPPAPAVPAAPIPAAPIPSKGAYVFPHIDLLTPPPPPRVSDHAEDMRMGATRLIEVLDSFGINAQMSNITRGPSVTRYELEMGSGAKLAKLTGLSGDIALAMGADNVNIMPIQGKMSVVGVEIPNRVRTMVTLREVLDSAEFRQKNSPTAFALGKDIGGKCIVDDIAKMPHLLVAGSTGSGKSVAVNSLIVSLLYKASPDDLKLILIDPKKVEFPPFNGIPHLGFGPVITDSGKAAAALEWAVLEMEKRYAALADCGKRDIEGYNSAFPKDDPEHPQMCRIVIIIDEMADLMMESKKERKIEDFIVRIAQKARACGIHLVLATQRPDAKVITGLIKANVPSRVALKVSSAINSRIVLDQTGAEKLIGYGDMLFQPAGANRLNRIQGCFVDEKDIHKIVDFIKTANGPAQYDEEVVSQLDALAAGTAAAPGREEEGGTEDNDPLLSSAIEIVVSSGQGSTSYLQRRLKVGHSRAGRLMDMMEERGIVGPFEGSKPRKILITPEQWAKMSE